MERQRPPYPLEPTSSGNKPGTPLFEYFKDKLPDDLPLQLLEHGLSCYGYARLIVRELGGPKKARILRIRRGGPDENTMLEHAFVVLKKAGPTTLAYNNDGSITNDGQPLTVGDVLAEGTDVTAIILRRPWERL